MKKTFLISGIGILLLFVSRSVSAEPISSVTLRIFSSASVAKLQVLVIPAAFTGSGTVSGTVSGQVSAGIQNSSSPVWKKIQAQKMSWNFFDFRIYA